MSLLMRAVVCACAVALSGCSAADPPASEGYATAERDPDGVARARDSTPGEVQALRAVTQALAEIDGRFPRPTPTVTSRVRAVAMAADGVIELHDGRRIRIDGIRCSAGGLIYLKALVIGADVELFVEPSIGADGDPLPANVWTTDVADQRRNFSSPAEGALTSGWCTSEITATSMFNERYAALAGMASSRGRGN